MSRRLHIAQVLPNFEWGGTQALVVQFAREAAALDIDVTVVSLDGDRPTPYAGQLCDAGAQIRYIPGRFAFSPRRILRLARLLRDQRVDLVHAHLTKPNTLAPLAGWLAGCPVVVGLHTLPDMATRRGRLRAMVEAFSVRRAAGVISCAASIANTEKSRLAPHKIRVISNPVPTLSFDTQRRQPQPPIRFIAVGRLSRVKGFDLVIDAAVQLRANGQTFHIAIVGDGAEREALHRQIIDANLGEHVTLLGPRDDVQDLLLQSDVYLSCSRFEGLSIAMLEAMGHGLPVIATDVGDTAEVLSTDTGTLIAPDDVTALVTEMTRYITDPDLINDHGAAAQTLIKQTRAPRPWANRYIEIYRDTLTNAGKLAA